MIKLRNSWINFSYTVVSQKSAHPRKSAHPVLYRVKVYLSKCPPWSELCMANYGVPLSNFEKQGFKCYTHILGEKLRVHFTEGWLCREGHSDRICLLHPTHCGILPFRGCCVPLELELPRSMAQLYIIVRPILQRAVSHFNSLHAEIIYTFSLATRKLP